MKPKKNSLLQSLLARTFSKDDPPLIIQLLSGTLLGRAMIDIILAYFFEVKVLNMLGVVLMLGAGCSLMIRHKTAWLTTIVLCTIYFLIMSVSVFTDYDKLDQFTLTVRFGDIALIWMITTLAAYFFRYPFLDRRQHWLSPTGHRWKITTKITLNQLETQTLDISYTGAKVALPPGNPLSVGDIIAADFRDTDLEPMQAEVIGIDSNSLNLSFLKPTRAQSRALRDWLKRQSQSTKN